MAKNSSLYTPREDQHAQPAQLVQPAQAVNPAQPGSLDGKISRRGFISAGAAAVGLAGLAKIAGALGGLGVLTQLAGCGGKDYHTWVMGNNVRLPGQPGFLDERNLELFDNRYNNQAIMAKELLQLDELDMGKYDQAVSIKPGIQIVGFLHPFTDNAKRQLLSLAHVSKKTNIPLHMAITTYGSGNYSAVSDRLKQETKNLVVDPDFSSKLTYVADSQPKDIFPVTLFVKNGASVDMCWHELHTLSGVQKNAAILEYTINQMQQPDYKQLLKGRTVQEINKAPEFEKIVARYK